MDPSRRTLVLSHWWRLGADENESILDGLCSGPIKENGSAHISNGLYNLGYGPWIVLLCFSKRMGSSPTSIWIQNFQPKLKFPRVGLVFN